MSGSAEISHGTRSIVDRARGDTDLGRAPGPPVCLWERTDNEVWRAEASSKIERAYCSTHTYERERELEGSTGKRTLAVVY